MNYEKLALYSEVISSLLFLAAIIWVFIKYIGPGVTAAQTARNEEIASTMRRRDEAKAELERVRGENAGASKSIADIRTRGKAEAARERERLIAEARAEGERIVRNADGELDRSRSAAASAFQTRLIDSALGQARERAKQEVSPSIDRDVTAMFVQNVGKNERTLAEVSNA